MRKKLSLIFFIIILSISSWAQGVKLMLESEYLKLPSPPIVAGAGELKNEYVIPKELFPEPGEQKGDYSCVGWAAGYAYLSYLKQNSKAIDLKFTKKDPFSPWYLYKSLKECEDCKCGIEVVQALKFLEENGNVTMGSYPYNPLDCKTPAESLKKIAKNYRIKGARRTEDLFNFSEIKNYLGNNVPVIAVIRADKAFKNFKDPDEKKPFVWKQPLTFENHAVLIVGYSEVKHAFKILNSYGPSWGTGGYGWLTYQSVRDMLKEAFTISKEKDERPVLASNLESKISEKTGAAPIKEIDSTDFLIKGSKETIRENRYHYSFRLSAEQEILSQVERVVYLYNDDSFSRSSVESRQMPSFPTSYDGYGCLDNMTAKIYLKNKKFFTIGFDGCAVTNSDEEKNIDPKMVEITPYVSVKKIGERDYNFRIDLRGIEPVKSKVDSVIYYWNHPTFKKEPISKALESQGYSNGYRGYGCLTLMRIIIYFEKGYQKTFNINMCDLIGWTDKPEPKAL